MLHIIFLFLLFLLILPFIDQLAISWTEFSFKARNPFGDVSGITQDDLQKLENKLDSIKEDVKDVGEKVENSKIVWQEVE